MGWHLLLPLSWTAGTLRSFQNERPKM